MKNVDFHWRNLRDGINVVYSIFGRDDENGYGRGKQGR